MEITKEVAEKVLNVVNAGLVYGLGKPMPGQMCVEAAVCYAFDLPHGDEPNCVGDAIRAYMIQLNDAHWPTNENRTNGLRKLSIAQLGSNTINQKEFSKIVIEGASRKIVPMALRFAAEKNPKFSEELEKAAKKCEEVAKEELHYAMIEARKLARKVRDDAAAVAAADAAAAAVAVAYAAADAAADAAVAAAAAAIAAAYAYAAAYRIKILTCAADIALDALIQLKSPGVEFLSLCE